MMSTPASYQPTEKPQVSIVILSALRQTSTRRCLESIQLHTKVPHEIIVVDMGVDMKIRKWLEGMQATHSHVRCIFNSGNVGTSRGRNQALERARSDWVVFLDNDAYVTAGWWESFLSASERHPDAGLFGAKIVSKSGYIFFCADFVYDHPDKSPPQIGVRCDRLLGEDEPSVNVEREVPWYPTTCLLGRTDVIRSAGGFDEKLFSIEEDKDLCLSVASQCSRIIYCPTVRIVHDRPRDADYERRIRYQASDQIERDLEYFERKWSRRVALIYSEKFIPLLNLPDTFIQQHINNPARNIIEVIPA